MKGCVIFLASVVSAASAWAQTSAGFGIVSGIVTQAGAEGMPDATVVLSNPTLGTEVTLITTDDGVFAEAAVVPSSGYALKVTRKGFTSWESSRFTVSAVQTVELRIPLQAEDAETKGGNGSAAGTLRVDTTKSGTAELVTAGEVEALPASERRLDELIPVAPAVTVAESQPG